MNDDKLEYYAMNLRFLRTFVPIADNAGFARAAARLNLTQSAASRQIQALEDELGLRLFARVGRSARLTAEGEDLVARSRRLLSDVEAIERAAHGIAVVPSPVRIPRTGVRVAVVVHRRVPVGRWAVAAWDPERFLAPYAVQFVEELVNHCARGYPGSEY